VQLSSSSDVKLPARAVEGMLLLLLLLAVLLPPM
jgi:hypothetical protein